MNHQEGQLEYENIRFGRSQRGRRMNRFEREIVRFVLSTLRPHSLVIDVPCGLGRFGDIVMELGHRYVGIDLNFGNVHHAANRLSRSLPMIQGSILELPLANDSADFVFCVRIFHHFSSEQIDRTFQEISRVAPQSLVTFYNRHTWRVQRRRFSPRIRFKEWRGGESWDQKTYSVLEIERLAKKAGLRIKEKIPSSSFLTTNQFLWLERIQSK